ncbi:MAG: S8 family serine peptidase [Bacteroidales bacterium]|nr:S8 family serine peptidase [Bacteroidales bacterium]
MKTKLVVVILLFFSVISFSQNRYWVFFTNKKNSTFDPYSYFDQKAIDRRVKHGVPLYDSSDFPVNQQYISSVNFIVDSVNTVTRWFNGVSVIATPAQISEVLELSFVKNIEPIFLQTYTCDYDTFLSSYDSVLLNQQLELMQGSKFINNNFNGAGIRIAIFDAGFPSVDIHPVFEHIRNNNRIIKTYDFAKKNDYVYKYSSHGTMVMSCIAGITNGINIGLATGAEFLLARTEISREPFSEEENWLAAAEWADKNGADIITSSLGYTVPRYFQYNMDGKTTFVAKAAKMASDKGILVVNAMGNDGDANWKVVGTPADAQEVLSVGGVEPDDGTHIYFSSFGPTADGRLKPEVCAAGKAIVASKDGLTISYGTSFSTPLITGFAACALQTDPSLTNMQLKQEIINSASLFPYFDYAHGYGIPQASYFVDKQDNSNDTTFYFTIDDDIVHINILKEDSIETEFKFLYYNFSFSNGKISQYGLFQIEEDQVEFIIPQKNEDLILKMFFDGYYTEYIIK